MTKIKGEPKTDMNAGFNRTPLSVPDKANEPASQPMEKGKNNMKNTQFSSCRLSGWIVQEKNTGEDKKKELEMEDGEEYGRIKGEEEDEENKKTERSDKDISGESPASGSTCRKPDFVPLRSMRLHWWEESGERSKSDSN